MSQYYQFFLLIDNGCDKRSILFKDNTKEKYMLNLNLDNKFICTLIKESAYNYRLYLKGIHEKIFPLLTGISPGSTIYEMFDKYKEEVSKKIKNIRLNQKEH